MKLEKLRFLIKISIQFIKKDKIRSLLTLCTVIICVFLIYATANNMVTYAYMDYYSNRCGLGDWLFSYTSKSDEITAKIDDIVDVKETTITSIIGIGDVDSRYKVELTTYSNFNLIPEYLYKGDYPKNQDEILITREYEKKASVDVGDTITMEFTDPDNPQKTFFKTMRVSGIIQFTGSINAQDGTVNDKFILHSSKKSENYNIYVKTDIISNEQLDKIKMLVMNDETGASMNSERIIDVYTGGKMYSLNSINKNDIVIFIVLLVLMYFTLKNIFAISFKKRCRYFGILSSVGASKNDLKLLAIIEVLIYSFIAITVGMITSNFVMKWLHDTAINNALKTEFNMRPNPFMSVPSINILIALVIVIVLLFASLTALKEIKRINIIDLFKSLKWQMDGYKKKSRSILLDCRYVFVTLAIRYMKMNKKKYFSILMTLIFCIVFLNINSYRASINDQYIEETVEKDSLYLRCEIYDLYQEKNNFNKLIKTLKEKEPQKETTFVADFNFGNIGSISLNQFTDEYLSTYGTPEISTINIYFFGVEQEVMKEVTGQIQPVILNKKVQSTGVRKNQNIQIFKNGKIPITMVNTYTIKEPEMTWEKEEIEFMATADGIYELDSFNISNNYENLLSDIEGDERLNLMMVAPYDYYLSRYDEMQHISNNNSTINFKIKTDDHAGLKEEIINDKFVNNYLKTIENNEQDEYSLLNNAYTKIITYLSFTVCIINLAIIIVFNAYERQNDYAILQSLGIKNHDLKKMIFFENLCLVIIALVISIPMIIFIEGILFYYQYTYLNIFKPSYYTMLFMAVLVVIIALLATLLLYQMIKKKSIIEKIKGNDI